MAVMLAAAVVVVPAAAVVAGAVAVLAMGLGAEAVPAVPGVPAMVRVGAAEAVPAMGRAGVVAVDGVIIIAAMAERCDVFVLLTGLRLNEAKDNIRRTSSLRWT